MKYYFLFFVAIITCHSYSQNQVGITGGVSLNSFKSDDLVDVVSRSSISVGITPLIYLTNSSDLLTEVGYRRSSLVIGGYKDFNNETIFFNENEISIDEVYSQILYNQYLIVPDSKTFHASLQGGFGAVLFNDWTMESETFFNDRASFNPYYVFGVSGGTEQLRMAIRYNGFVGNPLKDVFVNGQPNENNISERRELDATRNSFSVSFTYFFSPFYN